MEWVVDSSMLTTERMDSSTGWIGKVASAVASAVSSSQVWQCVACMMRPSPPKDCCLIPSVRMDACFSSGKQLTQDQERRLQHAFELFDRTSSRALQADDLNAVLTALDV